MFRRSAHPRLHSGVSSIFDTRMLAKSILCLLLAAGAPVCGAEDNLSPQNGARPPAASSHYVTNAAQFSALSGVDFLAGCDFRLTGVVTLVDTNRDLLVLQDKTGAVAINFRLEGRGLEVGQLATLDGTDCCPYHVSFPDYPYRPSGWEVRSLFEAPV